MSQARPRAPDLSHVRRLGVYGGSFDPVHAGHLHVARSAQRAFALEHVVFVPAAQSPFKPGGPRASAEQRLRMLEIALGDQPSWSIATLELERPGPSYTIDTVRELAQRLGLAPACALYLLLGWDNLRGLERWREAREMLERVQPVVVWRGEPDDEVLVHLERELGPELAARLQRGLLRLPPAPEASTDLRRVLARGEDPGEALPPGVLEYIRAHGIYREPPSGDR